MPQLIVRQRTETDKITGIVKKYGWSYRFETAYVDGQRKRVEKGGFKTKKEAIAAGTLAIQEYENTGNVVKPTEMSVSDYFDLWMKEYVEINLKQTTMVNYRKKINNILKPALGQYKLRFLNAITIQNCINNCFEQGYSRNTLVGIKGILIGSLDYAADTLQLIKENPARRCRLPLTRATPKTTETRKHDRYVVPPEDMEKVFQRFPEGHPAHLPLMFGYRCGLRLGEAFAITFDNIDFEAGTLTIHKQVQMDEHTKLWQLHPPKYDSIRTIRLDDTFLEELKRAKKKRDALQAAYAELYTRHYIDESNHITTQKTDTEWHPVNIRDDGSYVQPRVMQHAFRVIHGLDSQTEIEMNFKFDFHSLRHTHATMLLAAGADPVDVKERLGHKNIETTLGIYTHNTDIQRERTVSLMNNLYK